jgi:aspartyl-tRNA(Asn)/glutamyl-tRNA(Gln) amidotransferase subunit A
MTELNALTIAEARDALRKGDVTSVELTEACLKAIDAADTLNAVVHKTPEIAMDRARAADARIKDGDAPAMCGIPVGIKDLFCTEGVASQAGSKILEGFRPEYESTVSGQLRDAGAVMLGKLNMDEFAMGSSNETSVYGNAVNPWRAGNSDAALTPGGSSGGSAAAVAADLCLGRDRHRHRRLHPPARRLHRHRGPETHLWPLLPLGDRGLRLLARSGGADDAHRARRRDHGGRDDGP